MASARTSASARVSWPAWWLKNHHQKRAMNPQLRGAILNQCGQLGGGSGASISAGSRSKLRPSARAWPNSMARGRVEETMTASLAAARSRAGADWPGLSPMSS